MKIDLGVDRLLRRRDVEAKTGMSRSTIYDWMKAGKFPIPLTLGARSVRWLESEISLWIAAHRAGEGAHGGEL